MTVKNKWEAKLLMRKCVTKLLMKDTNFEEVVKLRIENDLESLVRKLSLDQLDLIATILIAKGN